MYDYLIVGSGLFGSVFARQMTDYGFKCLIIEKRNHIGGNAFTENIEDINVHKYGAHIFHTNDESIWNYMNKYAEFNNYKHKVFVNNDNRFFSFPINLMTLNQLWGISNPLDAVLKINSVKKEIKSPKNLEEWILSQVGEELYELFIKDYTEKQWGRNPKELPSSIIKRIPIRMFYNDSYFDDKFQGIPIGGYTNLIKNIVNGIEVKLNVDFLLEREVFSKIARKIIYTGPIDEYFNYEYGPLEYRSLHFENKILDVLDYQGTSVVNYTNRKAPFTRIIEHKHFEFGKQNKTIITEEYPIFWEKGKEPYYPINDEKNKNLYQKYLELASTISADVIFGGRLAEYKYYDMHQVVGSAISKAKNEFYKCKI